MVAQPDKECQSLYGLNSTNLTAKIKQQSRIIMIQKARIEKEIEQRTQDVTVLYWSRELLANPYLSDKEKVCLQAYMDSVRTSKPREDGAYYYSRRDIVERLGGGKEKAVSAFHTALQKYGYIVVLPEKKKSGTGWNYFDKVSRALWNDPRNIQLDKHEEWGGNRVAIHKECGGVCVPEIVYNCQQCGECHIPAKDVILLAEEEYEHRQTQEAEHEQQLPTMEELDRDYAFLEACDIPDDYVDVVGADAALSASPREIGHWVNTPRYIREGLAEEDLEQIDALYELWKSMRE